MLNIDALKKFYKEHKRESTLAFIALIIIVGVVWLLVGALGTNIDEHTKPSFVPQEFTDARLRAIGTAEKLVGLTAEAAINIEKISIADQDGDYARGSYLVADERERNQGVRDTAVELSENLHDMANLLLEVRPQQASAVGFQAVTLGIELVQRMISYSNNIQELLIVVDARLRSGGTVDYDKQIQGLVGRINADVAEVNRLNQEYRGLMRQFNKLTAQGGG